MSTPEYLVGQIVSIKSVGSVWSKYEKGEDKNLAAFVQLSVMEIDLTEEEYELFSSKEYRLILREENDNYIIEKTVKFLG